MSFILNWTYLVRLCSKPVIIFNLNVFVRHFLIKAATQVFDDPWYYVAPVRRAQLYYSACVDVSCVPKVLEAEKFLYLHCSSPPTSSALSCEWAKGFGLYRAAPWAIPSRRSLTRNNMICKYSLWVFATSYTPVLYEICSHWLVRYRIVHLMLLFVGRS